MLSQSFSLSALFQKIISEKITDHKSFFLFLCNWSPANKPNIILLRYQLVKIRYQLVKISKSVNQQINQSISSKGKFARNCLLHSEHTNLKSGQSQKNLYTYIIINIKVKVFKSKSKFTRLDKIYPT